MRSLYECPNKYQQSYNWVFLDQRGWCIGDYGHGVSKVWSKWFKGNIFGNFALERVKHTNKLFQKHLDPIYILPG